MVSKEADEIKTALIKEVDDANQREAEAVKREAEANQRVEEAKVPFTLSLTLSSTLS